MGPVRRGERLQIPAGGSRMGPRQASGNQCQLVGYQGVRELALTEDWQDVSTPIRGGMGICRARGNEYALLVGAGRRLAPGELSGMRQRFWPANAAGRLLCG